MQSIRQIQRLNDVELEKCVPPNASWHTDYRDTAYIYIGGLPFELSEGDVLTIFSQYGNPVHINLMRDKDTGKSRGFAWLKYEDQRSCDLAVDNLSGAGVLGRILSVDHTRYKLKDDEIEGQGLEEDGPPGEEDDTDREGDSRRKRRRTSSAEDDRRPMLKEELELAQLMKEGDQDDPMKAYLIKEKKEEVAEALKRLSVSKSSSRRDGHSRKHRDDDRRHRHRSRDRDREDGKHRSKRHSSRSRDRKRSRSREHVSDRMHKDRSRNDRRSPSRERRRSRSREGRRERS